MVVCDLMDDLDSLNKKLQRKIKLGLPLEYQGERFDSESSYIYMVRCVGFDYYKIGRAQDATKRISTIQTGCPFEIRTISCRKVKKVFWVEKG